MYYKSQFFKRAVAFFAVLNLQRNYLLLKSRYLPVAY